MAQPSLDKLVKLRKTRADNAARDLAELRVKKTETEQKLEMARRQFSSNVQRYIQVERGFQAGSINSLPDFAAIQGDLVTARGMIDQSQVNISEVENELSLLEKRIDAARLAWRKHENAHERFVELTGEIKKGAMMRVLAAEEFMDS
jgi:flagellar biosynthesis chaperone FliJ